MAGRQGPVVVDFRRGRARHGLALALLCAACAAAPSQAAAPGPVKPGLWTVQILTTFTPDPQPGATTWPGLASKERARRYDICLDAARARLPMDWPRLRPGVEVKSDAVSMQASDTDIRSVPSAAQAMEWLYRRLSDAEFEGSYSITERKMAMTTAYRAVFVGADCGPVKPGRSSVFGEP